MWILSKGVQICEYLGLLVLPGSVLIGKALFVTCHILRGTPYPNKIRVELNLIWISIWSNQITTPGRYKHLREHSVLLNHLSRRKWPQPYTSNANRSQKTWKKNTSQLSSWWFQPIWKALVKLDHFPKKGWKQKIFETTTQLCVGIASRERGNISHHLKKLEHHGNKSRLLMGFLSFPRRFFGKTKKCPVTHFSSMYIYIYL